MQVLKQSKKIDLTPAPESDFWPCPACGNKETRAYALCQGISIPIKTKQDAAEAKQRPESIVLRCLECGRFSKPEDFEDVEGEDGEPTFDRYIMDDASIRPDLGKGDIVKLYLARLASIVGHGMDAEQPASSRIVIARAKGEDWTKNADAEHIRKLPETQRFALVAFYWTGLTAKEIAESLGCAPNTVDHLLVRARKFLGGLT
jgi:predicted RNA-binding Zn-ribbon protein involved in translation (DUF1610 family)